MQNGSIMEGLALWKNNVDKRFEGIEDCMICFSVIHGSNYSLPKKACRTCKKKFHSACLVSCVHMWAFCHFSAFSSEGRGSIYTDEFKLEHILYAHLNNMNKCVVWQERTLDVS